MADLPATSLKRLLAPQDLTCPAAQLLGECDVHCGVEDGVIDGRRNSESVERFCAGKYPLGYTACPSWQAEREAEWERRNLLRDGLPNAE